MPSINLPPEPVIAGTVGDRLIGQLSERLLHLQPRQHLYNYCRTGCGYS